MKYRLAAFCVFVRPRSAARSAWITLSSRSFLPRSFASTASSTRVNAFSAAWAARSSASWSWVGDEPPLIRPLRTTFRLRSTP